MKPLILFSTFLFFFWISSMAFAGGADEAIDPRNGCYAKVGYSGDEVKDTEADYINNRAKYLPIIGRDRYAIFTKCWQGKAVCIRLATECRKDGNIVYDGFSWQWRDKK